MSPSHLLDLPTEILDIIITQHVIDALPENSSMAILPLVGVSEKSPEQMREYSLPISHAKLIQGWSNEQSGLLLTCHLLRKRYLTRLQENIQLRIAERPPTEVLAVQQRDYDHSFQIDIARLSSVRHLELLTIPSNVGVLELAKSFPQLRSLAMHAGKKPFGAVRGLYGQKFPTRESLTAKHVMAAVREDARHQFYGWSGLLTDKRIKLELAGTYGIWVLNYRESEMDNGLATFVGITADCLEMTIAGHGGMEEETEEVELKVRVADSYEKALRIWEDKSVRKMKSVGPV